jgi:hypothetical protein
VGRVIGAPYLKSSGAVRDLTLRTIMPSSIVNDR